MREKLSKEILEAILNTLPVDLTFVDDSDIIIYYNQSGEAIFKRNPEVIGTKVQECHKLETVPKLNEILKDLKAGRRNVIEDWADINGRRIHMRYFPVKAKRGRYIGALEVAQDITPYQKDTG